MNKTNYQLCSYRSPWSISRRLRQVIWEWVWFFFCEWTPKPCNPWRLFILRCFGAKLNGIPFVHQRSRIDHPWNLTMHDKACLGDRAHAYCLGEVEIGPRACVAQEAYLCTGSHDLKATNWPVQTESIHIGADVFIGARAFLLPGVVVGKKAVIGACAVVTRNVASGICVVGNPARPVRTEHKKNSNKKI